MTALSPRSTVGRPRRRRLLPHLGANELLALGFASIITIGTVMLRLPQSSARGDPLTWGEALFTSTSATTVTGLVVVNTATDLSLLGQFVVLALMQIGGVGFVAFSVLLFQLIGRRVTLQERFLVQQTLGVHEASGALSLTLYVLAITLSVELVGAVLLFVRWRSAFPPLQAAYYSVFHAVSAYCNAGFDLFSGTGHGALFGFGADPYTLGMVGFLIVIGGLGITVLYDLWSYRRDRSLGLHTRLTLIMAFLLTVVGLALIMVDDNLTQTILRDLDGRRQLMVGAFTIVSARTAGLTILPIEQLSQGTQLILLIWMFIGAAPASMAGGVSTSTVAAILVMVAATTRGDRQAAVLGRALPTETINKAIAVMTVSTLVVVLVTLALVDLGTGDIYPVAFEVVSAFSNTGYSLGATGDLSDAGRLLIAFTMFWGRLGPLTVVVALAQREHPSLCRYPEERIILG